jgi:hypothetical protein
MTIACALSSLRSPRIGSALLAIAKAADGFAAREATTQAAMLRCEVLRNRAFMVPLWPTYSSPISRLRQRNDWHTDETRMLEQRCDVSLIETGAVERFGQYDIDLLALSTLQERLNASS